jgi:hypothetical protein
LLLLIYKHYKQCYNKDTARETARPTGHHSLALLR